MTRHWLGQTLIHLAALVVGAGSAAAVLTILTDEPTVYPYAFVTILVPASILGIPIYFAIRHSNRVNWKSALAARFIVGAITPAILVLLVTVINGSYTAAGRQQSLLPVVMSGLLGSLGASLFLASVKVLGSRTNNKKGTTTELRLPTWRGVALGIVALGFVGAAWELT